MVEELKKFAKYPVGPLQILQGELEIAIQLVVQTLELYKASFLRLPGGHIVRMSELGYEPRLCNMAIVNAAASWDGFKGNVVRTIRASGNTFSEGKLSELITKTNSFPDIIEPLARRHCIVHNLSKVDQDYQKDVPQSTLQLGEAFPTDLSYLKDSSVFFFNVAVEVLQLIIDDGLLPTEQGHAIGDFQRDPVLLKTR